MIGDSLYECIKEYDSAIEKSENNAENYFNRGNARLQQQEFELAHADFDKGIQLDSNNAKLYHAKGLAFQFEALKLGDKVDRDLELED